MNFLSKELQTIICKKKTPRYLGLAATERIEITSVTVNNSGTDSSSNPDHYLRGKDARFLRVSLERIN